MKDRGLVFAMTAAHGGSGGIATANLNVLHALVGLAAERRSSFDVFSLLETGRDRPDFLPAWVTFRAFGGRKLAYSVSLLRAMAARPLFCFDHVRLALPLLPLAAAGAARTIIFAHGSESWKRLRTTSRWSFRCASLCLANSRFTIEKMRDGMPGLNGEGCPLGLSPAFPLNREIPDVGSDVMELEAVDGLRRRLTGRVLLLVARMDSREGGGKGHRPLIQVLPKVLGEFSDVQLVCPGPGDDRVRLAALARTEGVAACVFLPGKVSVETLQALYRRCYAFVMPSRQEGFGLVYLEAMNYGKPCVGCFDQGAEDVIIHGETGLLVRDPDDPEELLDALRRLLKDPDYARALGRNGFARLHEAFTARHYQERIRRAVAKVM